MHGNFRVDQSKLKACNFSLAFGAGLVRDVISDDGVSQAFYEHCPAIMAKGAFGLGAWQIPDVNITKTG